jgi:uncharacterized protein YjiS (DUF1127 family)
MIKMEQSAGLRLPVDGVWVQRGEGFARVAVVATRRVTGWVRRGFSALGRVHARSVALRQLHALDDRLLQDIGLRRDQVGVTVEAMFRGDGVAETAQPVRQVDAGGNGDIPVVDASNDRHYRSAA